MRLRYFPRRLAVNRSRKNVKIKDAQVGLTSVWALRQQQQQQP